MSEEIGPRNDENVLVAEMEDGVASADVGSDDTPVAIPNDDGADDEQSLPDAASTVAQPADLDEGVVAVPVESAGGRRCGA